jgi:hypothetical protein
VSVAAVVNMRKAPTTSLSDLFPNPYSSHGITANFAILGTVVNVLDRMTACSGVAKLPTILLAIVNDCLNIEEIDVKNSFFPVATFVNVSKS